MGQHRTIAAILLASLIFIFLPSVSFPQELPYADTLPAKDITIQKARKHSLYGGLGYGSNMIYLGSTMSENQPFEYGALSYGFNNELFITISSVHLSDIVPFIAFSNCSLSWNHSFNSWFDLSAGLYRYQFSRAFADSLFGSFTYADATLGIDWRLLYSKISAGRLMSSGQQYYLQVRNSRYFETPEFFRKKISISFDPYINLLLGPVLKTEITTSTSLITMTQQIINPWSSGAQSGKNSGGGQGYGQGAGSGSASGSGTTSGTTTTVTPVIITNTSYDETFKMIDVEFGLPVSFNFRRLTIEAEASYLLPAYSDDYFPGPKGFVILLTGVFKIF